ncbi:hypothetical protein D3C77_784900 [compost metagenome]
MPPVSTVVPGPSCVTRPLPEITPLYASVLAAAGANTRAALLVTLPVMEPLVVPSPNCRVPAERVVPPL